MSKKASPSWTASEDSLLLDERASSLLPGRSKQAIKTRRKKLGLKMFVAPKWTSDEDDIVRQSSTSEAASRLPLRTFDAVRTRRKTLGVGRGTVSNVPWTKREDRILIKQPLAKPADLAKFLPNRTRGAITARRLALGLMKFRPHVSWKMSENEELKRLWSSATRQELTERFRSHSWGAIRANARELGLEGFRLKVLGPDLHQQVRQRSFEDRIAMATLGRETASGRYFCRRSPKTQDFNKIARAVEFFGGRLVIDWQDE